MFPKSPNLAFLDFTTDFCTEITFLEKEKLKTKQASAKQTGPLGYWAISGTGPNFWPKAETGRGRSPVISSPPARSPAKSRSPL
jgi:hypothetical protein